MSKKLLASLIALTMVSAFACGDDDKKDDKGGSCTLGEIQCTDGQTAIKVCDKKGNWLDTTCAEYKADVPNGVCQSNNCVTKTDNPTPLPGDCTEGTYACSGQFLQQCVKKTWQTAKTCTDTQVCDETLKDCKDKTDPQPQPQPGSECTATSTAQCDKACKADKSEGYYWYNDKLNVVTCANNDCYINSSNRVACESDDAPTGTACTAESTSKCDDACSADKLTRWYWNGTKVVEKKCKEATCVPEDKDSCVAEGEGGEKDPTVGQACDDSYKATCINDGANALVCNKGKVAQWTCADNQCTPNGSTADCPKTSSTTTETCTANSTAKCDKACKADKSEGYYWGNDKLNVKKCANKDCYINDSNRVACESEDAATDPSVGKACDDSYKATCINNGANALVCNKGKIAQWTCADNQCTPNGSTADCPKTSSGSGEDCTAASTSSCNKACKADKSEGYYWYNDKVNVKTCAKKDCYINDSNRVACESEDAATDPSVGKACDDNYKATCINGGANALVCNKGKIAQWTCADNQCTPNGSTADCPKESSTTPETCTGEDYTGTCADDKKTAVVCVKGEVKNYTCFNDICETRKDGTIYCPRDQAAIDNEEARKKCEDKEKLVEGGKAGDCCDTDNYKPAGCDTATNSGLRCSTGVIVEWKCTSPKVCNFDPTSTEYPGGKYSCK
ncbi:MAG: hypothetical protein J6A01_10955 [Proteobacteria bacterium]|nr:hypothetical protein [Pseudomonadota bacterium]